MKNCQTDACVVRILICKHNNEPGNSGHQDFPEFLILRYVEAFSEGLPIAGVYFLSFSLILLRSIVVYLKSGSRLTFLLTILLTFSLAFLLTFIDGRREEKGRRRKEGRSGSSLKI